MWAYDLEANTWTEKGVGPADRRRGLRFYDPVSGLVVALGDDATTTPSAWSCGATRSRPTRGPRSPRRSRWPSEPTTSSSPTTPPSTGWSRTQAAVCEDARPGRNGRDVALRPPHRHLVGDRRRHAAGLQRRDVGARPAIAYDEAAERTVMLGQGHSAAYDATADRWETLYEGSTSEDRWPRVAPARNAASCTFMVYDPVNERLVVYGGFVPTAAEAEVYPDDVLAFDTRTREWTVLLEPSRGQPAP